MKRRILLVDDDTALLARLEQRLASDYEVHVASGATEGLRRMEDRGPFAVVLSDHQVDGLPGVEFLGEVARRFPDTLRIMMTLCAEVDLALEALEEGEIFRFLVKPVPDTLLDEVLRQAALRYGAVAEERMRIEQLAFSREGLVSMNSTLEKRSQLHEERLSELEGLMTRLGDQPTIGALVEVAGEGLARLFSGQPLRLAVQEPEGEAWHRVEVGELGSEIERHPLGASVAGELLLDARSARTRGDRSLLGLAASYLGLAVARLASRVTRREARLGALRGLTRVAGHRDGETGLHLERVSLYCQTLARGLREEGIAVDLITDEFIEDIGVASMLHDIGKVAIPDAILLKQGKLTEDERRAMQEHAQRGAETLELVLEVTGEDPLVRMAHDVALHHHERWNGRGYPGALAGDDIPLAARIVAVADVYDALTSERPYKHAWTHAEALAEIQEQAGQHFDPALVVCMLARAKSFDRIRLEFADERPAPAA